MPPMHRLPSVNYRDREYPRQIAYLTISTLASQLLRPLAFDSHESPSFIQRNFTKPN